MTREQEIRDALKEFASKVGPLGSVLGTVKSVDAGAFTCVLYDEDSNTELIDVRLRPVLDDNDFLTVIPKVDTWALAIRIEEDEDWMILAVGEADKWKIKIGNTTQEIASTGIVFNGGNLGGMAKIAQLNNNFNSLKVYCEAMKAAVSSGLSAVGVAMAANGGTGATAFNTAMASQSITIENMEDTKVKH